MPLALLMECLYCHKKFSSFRFWKNSEFCSEEHAEAYRGQTLSRLMDTGGDEESPSPAFEEALKGAGESHEIAPSEYTGARQIEPPPVSASAPDDAGGDSLPPAGTHALEADLSMGDLTSEAGNRPLHTLAGDDVDLQTPEEALNALRALAQKPDLPIPASRLPLPEQSQVDPQPEAIQQQAESAGLADDVDADDVFAELRKMAAASGQVEPEGQDDEAEDEEAIHLPTAPDGVSAFDRLMETPAPSAGVGGPRLDRRLQVDKQAEEPAPTFAATTEDVVEQDATVEVEAVEDQAPVSAASAEVVAEKPDEPPVTPTEPDIEVSVEGEVSTQDEAPAEEQVSADEAAEKVVSFPGPQEDAGHDSNGRRAGRMARTRGAASGLFDSGIHEEFVTVGLSGLTREVSGLPVESVAVVLDELLKAPDQGSSEAPVSALTPQGSTATDWPVMTDVATIWPAAAAALPRPTSVVPERAVWTPARANLAPAALTFISPHRVFSPVEGGNDLLAAISSRDVGEAPAESVIERSCEPYSGSIEPYLPVGLAQSMGVVVPNRGQLIRSELFIKEPEARECTTERLDATPETDVRRAFYGRQGTA